MLYAEADVDEQPEPRFWIELRAVAIIDQGDAVDVLHREVGPPIAVHAGIEHTRDRGMIHPRERVPFGLEAAQHCLGVQAGLDALDCDLTLHRFALLGEVYDAHAAFADAPDHAVRADCVGFGIIRVDAERALQIVGVGI